MDVKIDAKITLHTEYAYVYTGNNEAVLSRSTRVPHLQCII